jgi:hypothetical protein
LAKIATISRSICYLLSQIDHELDASGYRHPVVYCLLNHSLGRWELAKMPYLGQILPGDPQPIHCFGFFGFAGTMEATDIRLLLEGNL